MVSLSYSELDKMIEDARHAYEHIEKHFDELMARPTEYTLFGPRSYGIGAASPAICTKKPERVLQNKTRRKDYLMYELDTEYCPQCIKHMENHGDNHCTYLGTEINGVMYYRSFFRNENRFYTDCVHAVKFADNKPVYYAESSHVHLVGEFYEYIDNNRMVVTTYAYHPHSKYTTEGEPICKDAPVGAPNSPAWVTCSEEEIRYIDFASWSC